jgi:predicted ATP-grasp superfamily ATP-dependent carboligase
MSADSQASQASVKGILGNHAGHMPPCLVLGIETQIGLAVVRELGRAGIIVIGIAFDKEAIGLSSRFLHRGYVLENGLDQNALKLIRELGKKFGETVLLAVSETSIAWLLDNREKLGNVRPVIPSAHAFSTVLDKQRTLAIARNIGIRVPATLQLKRDENIASYADKLKFPIALKWPDPLKVYPLLRKHKLELVKCEYASTPDKLTRILERYKCLGVYPLIQEYCPGTGLGQFFFMHKGEAVRRFQHIRIAEWPPEGGSSAVCDSVPLSEHKALQEKSIALLKAIGWDGVAMVEYRYDSCTDNAVLMEINGRFWGSLPLAVQCRAGFALLSYSLGGCGWTPKLDSLRDGQRCRMLTTELKRLYRILWRSQSLGDNYQDFSGFSEITRFVADFFKRNVGYYVWSLDDPGPFFTDVSMLIKRALRQIVHSRRTTRNIKENVSSSGVMGQSD